MDLKKNITLKHLFIDNYKFIGLQFYADKVINSLIKELPDLSWSEEFNMYYIPNNNNNLDAVFKLFRGVAWVNGQYFFQDSRSKQLTETKDIEWFRKRKRPKEFKTCPENYLQKLELKRYANNTIKTYINCFESFINYFETEDLESLNENDVRDYITNLIREKRSNSYINQAINSIKFYYEIVLGMPNRFYSIERPRKEKKLPIVLSS